MQLNEPLIHRLLNAAAILGLSLIGLRALTTLDYGFDTLFYHYPFAARLGGIYTPEEYQFTAIQFLIEGFPILGELLQGILWRVTGLASAANLFNWLCLLGFIGTATHFLRLHFWQVTLYSLSIPLVLLHASSSMMDLAPAAFIGVSCVFFWYAVRHERYTWKLLVATLLPLAIASNLKFQALIAGGVWGLIIVMIFAWRRRAIGMTRRQAAIAAAIVALIGALGSATYLKNFVVYQNPFYPLEFKAGPVYFAGPWTLEQQAEGLAGTTPNALKGNHRYFNYLLSLVEFYNYNVHTGVIWTIDQGQEGGPIIGSFRMGGLFVGNVILWGLTFAFFAFRYPQDKRLRYVVIFAGGAVLLSGFLPQAHIFRYWLFMPLFIVLAVLLVQQRYWNKEKSMLIFVNLLQICFFIAVLRFIPQTIVPWPQIYDRDRYVLNMPDSKQICIIDEKLEGILYRLANPKSLHIQVTESPTDCVYSPELQGDNRLNND